MALFTNLNPGQRVAVVLASIGVFVILGAVLFKSAISSVKSSVSSVSVAQPATVAEQQALVMSDVVQQWRQFDQFADQIGPEYAHSGTYWVFALIPLSTRIPQANVPAENWLIDQDFQISMDRPFQVFWHMTETTTRGKVVKVVQPLGPDNLIDVNRRFSGVPYAEEIIRYVPVSRLRYREATEAEIRQAHRLGQDPVPADSFRATTRQASHIGIVLPSMNYSIKLWPVSGRADDLEHVLVRIYDTGQFQRFRVRRDSSGLPCLWFSIKEGEATNDTEVSVMSDGPEILIQATLLEPGQRP